jgi:low temperature requirement protein LtrA
MRPRDPNQSHRAISPLELLTDLCFVVAVAQAALGLHHAVSENHVGQGVQGFAMAFFAIWWAWLNFTWFASAYDNDDVIYRLLTIVQIFGSLVLAAGITEMFDGDFKLGVIGYLIMRFALVLQWLRAARHDRQRRVTCLRYAVGIVIIQVGWTMLLVFFDTMPVPLFVLLVVGELLVPIFAERAGETPWHPYHIAERYGLFYIIVLGETILSSTTAISQAFNDDQTATRGVFQVVVAGLLIVFSVWWIYFARSSGDLLARIKEAGSAGDYMWGFGHYFIFAAAAAIGAGLAARVDYWTHHSEVPGWVSAAAVTAPTAVLLTALWLISLRQHDPSARTIVPFGAAVVLILLSTVTPWPEILAGLVCACLVAVEVRVAGFAGPAGLASPATPASPASPADR